MQKSKKHIIYCYLLLTVFSAGQYIVFTHHHKAANICNFIEENHGKPINYHIHSKIITCVLCEFVTHKSFILTCFFQQLYLSVIVLISIFCLCKIICQRRIHLKSRAPPLYFNHYGTRKYIIKFKNKQNEKNNKWAITYSLYKHTNV
jgi:hypothetical protein